MTTKEYSSYIKGLMDGTSLDLTTPEGKVISALVDLCDKMAGEIESLTEMLDTANDYLDELDHDLGDVEEYVYGDEDDECACGCHHHHPFDEDDEDFEDEDDDEEEEDEEEEFYCAECPNCGGKVYFDDSVNPEDVICPACHQPLISDEDADEGEDL